MALAKHKITPCLWFDTQAEEAAKFYCSIFKDSRIGKVSRYTKAGQEVHHKPSGSVMVVEFEIEGQTFTALNGGPDFTAGAVRDPGRGRLFLGQALARRPGGSVRLAEGQVRPVVAGRARGDTSNDDGSGSNKIRACHERFPENEEARHRRNRARL